MAIDAKLIKELRERTSAGMMDCKNALEATEGQIEAAVTWLREKGIAKAVKKADRVAAEGLTNILTSGNTAVINEINSETDFVSQNEQFLSLVQTVSTCLLENKPTNLETALALTLNGQTLAEVIAEASAVIGEKITLRRFEIVEKTDAQVFGPYLHMGGRIGVLSLLDGQDEAVAKDVSMQVAALNPQFISRDDVDQAYITKERDILKQQALEEGKPAEMVEKMVEGRLKKQLKDVCLLEQPFVKDSGMSVEQYVSSHNCKVVSVIRYAVGEGIEKVVVDFAEEVMSQVRK